MGELMTLLQQADGRVADYSAHSTLLSLLMALVVGQALAWTYTWTHSGLSYSRAFTQSLVLLTMVVSLVMFVIGNSIVTAFGLIGALAIIRFRNVLKDTRDTSFIFFALVLGMAIGSQRYFTAIVGLVVLTLVTIYLHLTGFGARDRYDGHLACTLTLGEEVLDKLKSTMRHFCRGVKEITARHGGMDGQVEYVYQVRLRDRRRGQDLLAALRAVDGVGDASLVLQDELSEF